MSDQTHLGADSDHAETLAPEAGMIRFGDEGDSQAALAPPGGARRWLGADPGRRYRLQQSGVDILALFVILQVGSIIYAVARPSSFAFMTRPNLLISFQTIPLTGIVALGVGLLMIAGEFDLSVGANFIFSSVVMAQLNSNDGVPIWLAALIGLGCGLGIGLLNGVITLYLKIPSFIATLGTMGFWEAAVLFVHGAAEQTFTPTGVFNALTNGTWGVLPAAMIWFVLLAVAGWALLQRNKIGNHIFAVGGDKMAAVATGVQINRTKLVAFGLTGLLAALAGILAASQVGDISPSSEATLLLTAIAACVIGGALLAGGKGTILGIFLGSCLIYWIQDVLLLAGAPGYYLTAFVGVLIVAAAVIYQNLQARRA
jgi:ribose/xylose/arabinose/galactoside ABC-type transport system permease subunit